MEFLDAVKARLSTEAERKMVDEAAAAFYAGAPIQEVRRLSGGKLGVVETTTSGHYYIPTSEDDRGILPGAERSLVALGVV